MQCTSCGRDARAGSSFCPHCGEPALSEHGVATEMPAAPSPFSRDAQPASPGDPPPHSTAPAPPPGPPGPASTAPEARSAPEPAVPFPAAGPPAAATPDAPTPAAPAAPTRSFTDLMAGFSSGLLGAVLAGTFGVLQVLAALVTALNDNEFSKPGFLVIGLLVVGIACLATAALVGRARQARAQQRPLDPVEALSLGAGVFVSTYGLLILFSVLVSQDGAAIQLLF